METLQISLVQALAPEHNAPEAERTDEFSSILSGKEAESKAESPPGQPPPPVQKPAVEEAENQEPNAQSQKPDFHSNDEANPDSESSSEHVDVPEGTKPTDGDTQPTAAASSTSQIVAQSALAWIGLLPEPAATIEVPLKDQTVTTVQLNPVDVKAPTEPVVPLQAAQVQSTNTPLTAAEVALNELPAEEPFTTTIKSQPVDSVPVSDLLSAIEDKPADVQVRVQHLPAEPTEPKAKTSVAPVQNPKVEQVATTNLTPIHQQAGTASQAAPPSALADFQASEVVQSAIETELPAETATTVTDKAAVAKVASTTSPEIVNTHSAVASEPVAMPTTEAIQQTPSEAVEAEAKVAPQTQTAETAKPATKADAETKPVEKPSATGKSEPLHKPVASDNQQAFAPDEQAQNGQEQNAQSNKAGSKAEPLQTAGVQQTRHEFNLATDKQASVNNLQPIDSKKTSEVVRQIVDRIETIAATHRPGGIVIRLNPEDLGTITMAVKSIGDQVEAHIVASDDRVRTALDTSRSQLAQAIEAKGFSLKSVTVAETASTQTQGESTNQNSSQSQQQTRQDQQSLREQSNMWTYAYSNANAATQRSGFARTASSGLDLWT